MEKRCNLRLICMLALVSILGIGIFSLCAKAATGRYVRLYSSGNGSIGAATATNISDTTRYINMSIYVPNGTVIEATGGRVGSGAQLAITNVNIENYSQVRARCSAYNSAAPQSGIIETVDEQIK